MAFPCHSLTKRLITDGLFYDPVGALRSRFLTDHLILAVAISLRQTNQAGARPPVGIQQRDEAVLDNSDTPDN